MGLFFTHSISNSSIFQSQLFWICRCSPPVYFHTNLKPNPLSYHRPTKPKIKPEKYENGLLHQNGKNEICFFNQYTSKEIVDQLKKSCQQQLDRASSWRSLAQLSPACFILQLREQESQIYVSFQLLTFKKLKTIFGYDPR